MGVESELSALQGRLGYRFADESLLRRALTHRSAPGPHNERLEFLGDAVLGYVVGDYLHRTRRNQREDSLTLLRSAIVKKNTLVVVAREIGLGDYLFLGVGERRSGAHNRGSLLADALEALIGAVHEDGGIEAARALVLHLFGERLENLSEDAEKDPKSVLQELLQAQGYQLPQYRTVTIDGQPHARIFDVACELPELELSVSAVGGSRKEAETRAAVLMIDALQRRGL